MDRFFQIQIKTVVKKKKTFKKTGASIFSMYNNHVINFLHKHVL